MMMITQQHCSYFLHRSLKRNCRHMHDWQAEQKKNCCHLLRMDGFFVTFHERIFLTFFFRYIFCVLLIAFLCHGKILFLFTATFNSFSSHCLTRSTSCSAFYASFLKYKVSTYGIYLYKNSLDDFSAM